MGRPGRTQAHNPSCSTGRITCPPIASSGVRHSASASAAVRIISSVITDAWQRVPPKPRPGKMYILLACEGLTVCPLCLNCGKGDPDAKMTWCTRKKVCPAVHKTSVSAQVSASCSASHYLASVSLCLSLYLSLYLSLPLSLPIVVSSLYWSLLLSAGTVVSHLAISPFVRFSRRALTRRCWIRKWENNWIVIRTCHSFHDLCITNASVLSNHMHCSRERRTC